QLQSAVPRFPGLRSKICTLSGREEFVNPFFKMRGLLVFAVLLFLAAPVTADTLILRDGRRIQGQLISFQNGVVEFQEAGFGGRRGRINRGEVPGLDLARVERDET